MCEEKYTLQRFMYIVYKKNPVKDEVNTVIININKKWCKHDI